MYKIAILKSNFKTISKNVKTKKEADEYILDVAEKGNFRKAIIKNVETGKREIIREL